MITIYKYALNEECTEIDLPYTSEVLSVGLQASEGMEEKEVVYLWIKLNTELQLYKRYFVIYGTGHEMNEEDNKHTFIGTVQMNNGLVWHIFERSSLIN